MTTKEVLAEASKNISDLISARRVMGDPIDLGDKVVIPVTRFGIAFGAGSGNGKEGDGSGAGGGGGVEPMALLVAHKEIKGAEGIQVFSLKKENPVAQVITALSESLVPQVIELVKQKKPASASTTEEEK
ncbi:MAG TPA: spore germination protein GerW family protein [Methanospirillum sp.]|uniref:GerW family sporulation protein n=1 Tax=Methanospirillum sp. TaxID=45200 RepID=UPI002BDC8EF4|nr:spore germination protein GerW family protein [Methanospirillum sp.]HOJ97630.1 spore germination protein GerW family protein [Methanospirillum sp.]HOL40528.1 spore germination protein GerW family protein [Methanospirillum sp.]HPP78051.1 spore germination protein GerW family protein [Methanospirillum sp.]